MDPSGGEATCFPSQGEPSCIDYCVASRCVLPFIEPLEVVARVPWRPHVGMNFQVEARLGRITYRTLAKPKAIVLPRAPTCSSIPLHEPARRGPHEQLA